MADSAAAYLPGRRDQGDPSMTRLVAMVVLSLVAAPLAAAKPHAPKSPQAVACETPSALYQLLTAKERHDAVATARLLGGECTPLAGLHYELVGEKNGVS